MNKIDNDHINEILSLRAEALQLQQEAKAAGDINAALFLGSELALIDFTLDEEGVSVRTPESSTK